MCSASPVGWVCTARYSMFTSPFSVTVARVCFIQFTSSRSGKSSRAWAPRLSLRFSAPLMVMTALARRFCSSSVSTRSVFQIRPLSVTLMSSKSRKHVAMRSQPWASVSWVRNTAASCCMIFCILRRTSAVDVEPLAQRRASRLAIDCSPALGGRSGRVWPGLEVLLMCSATARPNTTRSRRELAPRRLAPWTEAHAASPQAMRPGMMTSLPLESVVTLSPVWRVGQPPML
mmetsp:Transcript_112055/g.167742  ORF Transcript_112055/g.167742 Transcript_112055/m.167742 type:complete len:231 (-) Transcript_112055:1047-1739(-)